MFGMVFLRMFWIKYGLSYDQDWLDKCVDQTKRNDVAEWDEQGNLIT